MELNIYQVDAFADKVFTGNPAAIVPLKSWLPDTLLQAIALENNLSETAYIVEDGEQIRIRWFTPASEVPLCGHATLAAAAVMFECLGFDGDEVVFDSLSGELKVRADKGSYTLDFPVRQLFEASAPAGLIDAMGSTPQASFKDSNDNYLLVYPQQETVEELTPDMLGLAAFDAPGIIATAAGREHDFVSRFFAPRLGIDEDPVTGSAHCMLVPYWAERLGKTQLHARQCSPRGGELFCELRGLRVTMTGTAVMYLEGKITV